MAIDWATPNESVVSRPPSRCLVREGGFLVIVILHSLATQIEAMITQNRSVNFQIPLYIVHKIAVNEEANFKVV